MRIRKRQVPFPLSPVTLSDPNRINRSPVLLQLNNATTTSPKPFCTYGSATAPIPLLDRSQPSDQPLPPIGKTSDGYDDSSGCEGGAHQNKQDYYMVEDEGVGGQKGNDTRKEGILCGSFSPPSPSKQDMRWCEGEKAFPPKKRRGSLIENSNNNNNNNNTKRKMKLKMKTKLNKKCSAQDDDTKEGEDNNAEEEERETKPDVNVGNKKRVRGGALMEGSRCSRVNGRGWRCCQQTLVGYSLCEHHLGKGRLRSMTSVRSRSIATTTTIAPRNMQTKCVNDSLDNDSEDNDEKKPVMNTKKKMKLGIVKARSISSLLGQTNNEITVADENNK
ncbi:uncharacterized protein LOC133286773 [Gastrolobium bilobum]|uniref:uncharacterized protein LOC133286773 n=1 Tax=Gastrolobium bilobum TaxID=150636 RepID=UPI002AB1D810|nr:uncharacterized protein LOC133286773 [Gastrolobium bilobum]